MLKNRPVLMHTIDGIRKALPDALITLVINPDFEKLWADLCSEHSFTNVDFTTYGGATRWESVRNGLATVSDSARIVMVHDGARPMASVELINELAYTLRNHPEAHGAIPVIPVTDSIRIVDADGSRPFPRETLRAIQTPQAFPANVIRDAYKLPYSPLMTDDATVAEIAGFTNIQLTHGSPDNIKITNPRDIAFAELMLSDAVS